jgi:hypothetical protein
MLEVNGCGMLGLVGINLFALAKKEVCSAPLDI